MEQKVTAEAEKARKDYMRSYMQQYMKEWRRKNPEKAKEIRDRYWQKRAEQESSAEQ